MISPLLIFQYPHQDKSGGAELFDGFGKIPPESGHLMINAGENDYISPTFVRSYTGRYSDIHPAGWR